MKHGSKQKSKLLTVWMPKEMFPSLDRGARVTDSDRSKFVRVAIREKLSRHGIAMEAAQ